MKAWVSPVYWLLVIATSIGGAFWMAAEFNSYGVSALVLGSIFSAILTIPGVYFCGLYILEKFFDESSYLTDEYIEMRDKRLRARKKAYFGETESARQHSDFNPTSGDAESQRELIDRFFFEYLSLGRHSGTPRSPDVGGFLPEDAEALSKALTDRGIYEVDGHSILTARGVTDVARIRGIETQASYEARKGSLNPSLLCKFCGKPGGVRIKKDTVTQTFTQGDTVGKLIGAPYEAEKQVLAYFCENCRNTWSE